MAKQESNVDLEHYRVRSDILKALAHPSRLLIIDELARGERCVGELQQVVGSDLSTVSKHLAHLRMVGIVRDRRVGLNVYYTLRVPCIMKFFGCLDAVLVAQGRSACCVPSSPS